MDSPWVIHSLSELASIDKKPVTPARIGDALVRHFSIPAFDAGQPTIEPPGNIKSGKLEISGETVLFSKLNPHIPRVWWPRPDDSMVNLASTEFVPLRASHLVMPAYLFQLVRSPVFLAEALARVKGTTGSHQRVDMSSLMNAQFLLPELEEQRRIAQVLCAIDDLIDTNERIGQRLNALASALGQRLLAGDGDALSATISDIASIAKGYSYRSEELTEGTGWLVGLKNVGRRGEFRPDGFKPLNAVVKPAQIVDNGDLVVAHTDLTQAREVIGRPVRVRRGNLSGTLVASLDLAVVRPNDGVSLEYLQAILESPAFREHALGYCNGTTVLHMSSQAVPSFPLRVPISGQMERFEELAPIRAAADDAYEAADDLRRIRDELLPLLMSGKVRVRSDLVAA